MILLAAIGIGAAVAFSGDDTDDATTDGDEADLTSDDGASGEGSDGSEGADSLSGGGTTDGSDGGDDQSGGLDAGADPRTVAELATSTVMILLYDSSGEPVCAGSGTIVGEDGTILTNAHVLDPSFGCAYERVVVALTEQTDAPPEPLYEADFLVADQELDLAVIRIARDLDGGPVGEQFVPVPLGDSDTVEIGDTIRILGYPNIGGETITFTTGTVSGFTAQTGVGQRSWIKTDATIAGGNSGGTAVDDEGRLIGIPTQGGASSEGPIVDCRVVTDTNGDGLVDDLDQCVPFGGFLNGIRPVNLARGILDEAVTAVPSSFVPEGEAAPVEISELYFFHPRFSVEVPGEFANPDHVVTASSADTELCFWFDWSGMVDGAVWDAVWLVDGEVDNDYSFFGETWEEGSLGQDYWLCATNVDGFPPGLYELSFFVNDEFVFAEAIEVTAAPAPVRTVTFVNAVGEDVCYLTVNPEGFSDIGLDELGSDEILPTDATRRLDLPDGTFEVTAYDCGGNQIGGATPLTVTSDATVQLVPGG